MIDDELRIKVLADVRRHCEEKGYRDGPGVNNFIPHDPVVAFGMAKLLAGYDRYLAVAPEGHIYGYFFERLGQRVLSIYVNYPPICITTEDDLSELAGQRVLLIEDDVASGHTLRLVVEHLRQHSLRSLDLYLGHVKSVQRMPNVPDEIDRVYVSEDLIDSNTRSEMELAFKNFFTT